MGAITDEITRLEEKMSRAELVSDPEFFEKYLAEDAILTGPDGILFSKADVVRNHRPSGARKFKHFDVIDLRVRELGDAAVVTLKIEMKTDHFEGALRFTRVWQRTADGWQIVAGHISGPQKR